MKLTQQSRIQWQMTGRGPLRRRAGRTNNENASHRHYAPSLELTSDLREAVYDSAPDTDLD